MVGWRDLQNVSGISARGLAATRELRAVVELACVGALIPAVLRDEARGLCDDVDAGRTSVAEVGEEIRAMLAGLALRDRGVGRRCCVIADALVAELTSAAGMRWQGLTVPGAADRANARTGLVELRFPATDFWSITTVAHEVGHLLARAPHLGPRPGAGNPIKRVIAGEPAVQREELFCDFYATYVLGSAYPAFMIGTELDPVAARPMLPFTDRSTTAASHPSPDKRVFVMLATLAEMDVRAGPFAGEFAAARATLTTSWQARLTGDATGPDDESTTTVLTHFLRRLWSEAAPALGAPAATSMAARNLPSALRAAAGPPLGAVNLAELELSQVVTAAWRARAMVADQASVDQIAANAMAVAHEVLAARANTRESEGRSS